MAGQIGWPATELDRASLAELYACWGGHARAQGWFREQAEPMTSAGLADLIERVKRDRAGKADGRA